MGHYPAAQSPSLLKILEEGADMHPLIVAALVALWLVLFVASHASSDRER